MNMQEVTRWDTEVSDVSSLVMIRLVDEGGPLIVDVEANPPLRRFQFVFADVFAYRRLKEEYLAVGLQRSEQLPRLGWTLRVKESLWVRDLGNEPIFVLHGGEQAIHFMVCTEDAVVEVLSGAIPAVSVLR